MYPQMHQGSAKVCDVDIVGEECEVYWSAKSGRWSVGRGEVKTLVVVSSVTRSGDIWW